MTRNTFKHRKRPGTAPLTIIGIARMALTVLAVLVFGLTQGQAGMIRVSQESSPSANDFDDNILGFIDPFDGTGMSAEEFYNYNGGGPGTDYGGLGSIDDDPFLEVNRSHAFFVEVSEGLSFVTVHDSNASGGSAGGGSADMVLNLLNESDGINFIALDDEPNPDEPALDDTFNVLNPFMLQTEHSWGSGREDGFIAGALDGNSWSFFARFDSFSGLDNGWSTISNDGTPINLVLEEGRRVRFDLNSSEVVPEPASLVLFGIGACLAAGGAACRRRRANNADV